MKISSYLILALLLVISSASFSFAQNVTLSWDQSTDPNVVGYKLYYKAGSSAQPFDGTAATEGASPIDVGDNNTVTLTNLPDGQVYYFAVTAYDAAHQESSLSNIVASQWIPALDYPTTGDTNVQVPLQFSWSNAPSGNNITYTLYYGTDPNLDPANAATTQTGSVPPPNRSTLLASALLLGLLGLLPSRRKKMKSLFTLAIFGLTLSLSSCGSNSNLSGLTLPVDLGTSGAVTLPALSNTGSSTSGTTATSGTGTGTTTVASGTDAGSTTVGTGTDTGTTTASGTGTTSSGTGQTPTPLFTKVVSGLTDSYFDVTDLQPSTKYYWKIVASDGQSQVESVTGSFTTQAF